MGDAASAGSSSGILIAVCAGIAVLSAAVGYVAERVVPVDKVQKPAPETPALTQEERLEKVETIVGVKPRPTNNFLPPSLAPRTSAPTPNDDLPLADAIVKTSENIARASEGEEAPPPPPSAPPAEAPEKPAEAPPLALPELPELPEADEDPTMGGGGRKRVRIRISG
jgi:hypothetical protein